MFMSSKAVILCDKAFTVERSLSILVCWSCNWTLASENWVLALYPWFSSFITRYANTADIRNEVIQIAKSKTGNIRLWSIMSVFILFFTAAHLLEPPSWFIIESLASFCAVMLFIFRLASIDQVVDSSDDASIFFVSSNVLHLFKYCVA